MSLNNLLNLVYFYFSQFQEVKVAVFLQSPIIQYEYFIHNIVNKMSVW